MCTWHPSSSFRFSASSSSRFLALIASLTAPALQQWSLNLNNVDANGNDLGALLYLTFAGTTFVGGNTVTKITLQSDGTRTPASAYTLSAQSSFTSINGTTRRITLSPADTNQVKLARITALNRAFLTIANNSGLLDAATGTPLVGFTGMQATTLVSDTTAPFMLTSGGFALYDPNGPKLQLAFNEPVDVTSLSMAGLSLGAYYNILWSSFSTSTTASPSGTALTIALSVADFDAILLNPQVCSHQTECWIFIQPSFINDMSGNAIFGLTGSYLDYRQPTLLLSDVTPPRLRAFALDMQLGRLNLTFTKPVSRASIQSDLISLQSAANITGLSGVQSYSLNSSVVILSPVDDFNVSLQLSEVDLSDMLELSFLKYISSTFISILGGLAQDLTPKVNPCVAIATTSALQAYAVVPNTHIPNLLSFVFDQNASAIHLEFDDVMTTVGIKINQFSIQSAANAGLSTTRTFALTSQLSSGNLTTNITIYFSAADVSALEASAALSGSLINTYLSFPSTAVTNAFGIAAHAVPTNAAVQAHEFIFRNTGPNLVSFSLNMNTRQLNLTFDNFVVPSSLLASAITLQDAPTASVSVALTSSSTCSGPNATSVTVLLSVVDLDAVKEMVALGKALSNTYITLATGAFVDLSYRMLPSNPVINGNALQAWKYVADSVPPNVVSVNLNMNAGQIQLSFSEPVNQPVAPRSITIQSASASPIVSFKLTGGTVAFVTYQLYSITILPADLYAIKSAVGLAKSGQTTFFSITSALCKDFAGNSVVAIASSSAIACTNYVVDTTPAVLLAFSMNLTSDTMTLTFNEPVLASTLDPALITVQDAALQTASYTLTGGLATNVNASTVLLRPLPIDMYAIKYIGTLGVDTDNTYMSIAAALLQSTDFFPSAPIFDGAAMKASAVVPDVLPPSLPSFTLNLDSGTLILTFDKPVLPATCKPSNFTLQSTRNATGLMMSLSASTPTPTTIEVYGTVLLIAMVEDDLNQLKLSAALGKLVSSTYLSALSDSVQDIFGHPFPGISRNASLRASAIIPDTTGPSLIGVSLNLDSSQLLLTFNEIVNPLTLDPTYIIVQSSPLDAAPVSWQLTGGVAGPLTNSTVVHVSFSAADQKSLTQMKLASTMSNTFIQLLAGTVEDVSMNPSQATEADHAVGAASVTPASAVLPVAAIAGGVIGGIALLLLIVAIGASHSRSHS